MKAVVATAYGPPEVLQLRDVAKPELKDHDVLVKIHATTATMGDCEMRAFRVLPFLWLPIRLYMGLLRPRKGIFGQDLAGEIEATGKEVTRFKPGDAVIASTGMAMSAHAEYIRLPESAMITRKPGNLTDEEAAPIPTWSMVALHFLREAHIQPGEHVLINGAGGSIGTFAVQLAKYYGAEVTAVDSAEKLDMLRAIGADHTLDYAQDDFTRHHQAYDVIFEVVGKASYSGCLHALKPGGRLLLANPGLRQMLRAPFTSMSGRTKVILAASDEKVEDLEFLKRLAEEGVINPVIDRRYPLEAMVDAHRYVESGHKQGHVVVTVGPNVVE
jgi:NADPH:quinone reductase-like Zn-dependent oxidoreductase